MDQHNDDDGVDNIMTIGILCYHGDRVGNYSNSYSVTTHSKLLNNYN